MTLSFSKDIPNSFLKIQDSHKKGFLTEEKIYLIRMGDNQSPLLWKVMVDVGDDLYSHVGLSSTGRSYYHGKTRLHTRLDGFNLCRCERDSVPVSWIVEELKYEFDTEFVFEFVTSWFHK